MILNINKSKNSIQQVSRMNNLKKLMPKNFKTRIIKKNNSLLLIMKIKILTQNYNRTLTNNL